MPKRLLILTRHIESASFRLRIKAHLGVLRQNGIESDVKELPDSLWGKIKLFRQTIKYDGVLLHKKRLTPLEIFCLRRRAKSIIYDFDDAVMYDPKNPDSPSPKRQKRFAQTVKMADAVIANTSMLADHARKFCENVTIIPTGLNIESYKVPITERKDEKIRLVWIGNNSTLGFLADIKDAFEQIGSRFDNVVLRIISNEFFDLENMPVEKCQWSLESQIPDLAGSDIGLAPMPDSKLTQNKFCFKIFQYAAVGLPIIASDVGANKDFITPGSNGLFASDCSDWVDKISQLVEDAELRKKLGIAAKVDVGQFNTDVIGKQLAEFISNCLR